MNDLNAASFPDWVEPMAATLTQERFTGPEWIFERKFDGIRLLAFKDGADVRLFSRNRLPQHIPPIADGDRAACRRRTLILDGEVTWGAATSAYHVFDILWLDGRDLTPLPLDERRALLSGAAASRRRCSASPRSTTPKPWERACREGWEGVIAKRRDSPYEHRRSPHWLKMKCEASQELVVGGFTDPQGGRVGLGALLVGYFEGDDFVFAGKVGTGFDTKLLLELRARLDALEIADVAVHQSRRAAARCARTGCARRSSCRSRSSSGRCTASCAIRGCSGVRADKPARDVVRETRDHASREGAVPRRRDHQGRARRVLRSDRARRCCRTSAAVRSRWSGIPRGIGAKGFFQKDVSKGFPDWLERVEVPKKDGTVHHPLVTDARSLLWLANQNTHHAARLDVARAEPRTTPTSASSISIRREDEPGRPARGGARAARPARRSSACRAG